MQYNAVNRFITNAGDSCGGYLHHGCLFFSHGISKTDAGSITKLDKEMFHNESWKYVYFRVQGSKVKVVRSLLRAGVQPTALRP